MYVKSQPNILYVDLLREYISSGSPEVLEKINEFGPRGLHTLKLLKLHQNAAKKIVEEITSSSTESLNLVHFERIQKAELERVKASCQDCTERRNNMQNSHDSLQKKELHLRKILQASPVGVRISNQEGQIKYVNRHMTELFETTADKMIGENVRGYYAEEAAFEKLMDSFLQKQQIYNREVRFIKSDGNEFWGLLSVVPFQGIDEVEVLAWIYDITERKAFEDKLARGRHAAEEASKTKSAFLANMSHELRTPLNAIIGYSRLVQAELEDAGINDMKSDMDRIISSGNHLLSMINDVLDISRIEAGKHDLLIKKIDLHKLVEEVVSVMEDMAQSTGNKLVVVFDNPPQIIYSDELKIRQNLLNMLSNALKFTQDGTVTVTAGQAYHKDSTHLVIEVSDTGKGIAEEAQKTIFDVFTPHDKGASGRYGSAGLGLAITARFCEMLDGEITVQSQVGKGTCFTMMLPADISTDRDAHDTEGEMVISGGWNGTILIIDDDPAIYNLYNNFLQTAGYRVVHANSAQKGMEMAKSIRPDLVLLDIILPDQDGWSVLTRFRFDPLLKTTPVIILTITEENGLAEEHGAIAQLTKPVQPAMLQKSIERVLGYGQDPVFFYVKPVASRTPHLNIGALDTAGFAVLETPDMISEAIQQHRPKYVIYNSCEDIDDIAVEAAQKFENIRFFVMSEKLETGPEHRPNDWPDNIALVNRVNMFLTIADFEKPEKSIMKDNWAAPLPIYNAQHKLPF